MFARASALLWFAWVVLLGIITGNLWRWHFAYFQSPGPAFYELALIFIPALAAGAGIYALIRRPGLARYEPAVFAALAGAACLIYQPKAALIVALIFLSCSASGRFALRQFGIALEGPLDRIVFGFGFGAAMLNVVLFAAALAGLLFPLILVVPLLLPLVLFWPGARQTLADFGSLARAWQTCAPRRALTGVAILFALVAVNCTVMIALAPSIAFDTIAFHLALVRDYAAQHRLRAVPGIDYTYYPQGMELLWTLAFVFGGQPAAQLTSALFFVLFVLVLLRLARDCGLDQEAAALAAVFAVTMPFLHWSGSVMKNDLALAFFEGLAVLAFLRWQKSGVFAWIAAGTFLLAEAFGIKLVALFGALPLALMFGYAAWRQPRRWRAAALLAAVFLIFGTGWMLRAYLLTGNPAAPESIHAATGKYSGSGSFRAKLVRDLEIPWSMTFHGDDFFESPLPSPAGIVLLAFAPLLLLAGTLRPKTRQQAACAFFAALYLIYWAVAVRKLRYAILPFGLLAIWLSAKLARFHDSHGPAVRVSLAAVTAYALLIATMGLMIAGINGPQFAYFAGKLDRNGYLRLAMRPYGAVEFLRDNAPPDARIVAVDNLARAYSADPSRFLALGCSRQPCDAARIDAAIRDSHAEYLILPEDGPVSAEALERLHGAARLYRDRYYSVYRLLR